MKLKCIACEALARILYYNAATTPHIVDIDLFELGLHNEPADLQATLQAHIDAVDAEKYDAIVMGYGLCGKATDGITARELKIVVPRAHDCITLTLPMIFTIARPLRKKPGWMPTRTNGAMTRWQATWSFCASCCMVNGMRIFSCCSRGNDWRCRMMKM